MSVKNVGYGTYLYACNNDIQYNQAIKDFESSGPGQYSSKFLGCFTGYWYDIRSDTKRVLFGFQLLPIWYTDLVEQFNREFKNIKIKVVYSKSLGLIKTFTDPERGRWNEYKIVSLDQSTMGEFKKVLFELEFSPEYTSTRALIFIISIFLRLMSLVETNDSCYRLFPEEIPDSEDIIQYLLNINTRVIENGGKYRSLCEFVLSKEHFMLLDNPKLVNKLYSTRQKQTAFFKSLLNCDPNTYKIKLIGEDLFLKRDYTKKVIKMLVSGNININDVLSKRGGTYVNVLRAGENLKKANKIFNGAFMIVKNKE